MTHARNHNHHWPTPSPTPKKKKKKATIEKEEWCLGLKRGEADEGTEKEEREENWNNEIEEREIFDEKVNKIYIFFRILLQYNSNFRIVL